MRLWTLKIHDTIEAVLVGFLDNGVLHYFQKGFNPKYAKDDLGTAMLGLCVRECFDDEEVRAFDFMGGGAKYKELWARVSRDTMSCEVHRTTVTYAALRGPRTCGFLLQVRIPVADSRLLASCTWGLAPEF